MDYTKSPHLVMIRPDKNESGVSMTISYGLGGKIMARGINTKCLHLEEEEGCCNNYGAISFPIYQTATYEHPAVGHSTGFDYSRLQNPTREHLEKIEIGRASCRERV